MARKMKTSFNAKRANRKNPREDRNSKNLIKHDFETNTPQDEYKNRFIPKPIKKISIIPRNLAQEAYVDELFDDEKKVVIGVGNAGTGKTFLAVCFAIDSYLRGDFKKIIITRPAVSVDESHGFLPGSLTEKYMVWCYPIMSVFKEYFSAPVLEKMLLDETILFAPLAYMRGASYKDSIMLFDEAQNATVSQVKTILTRLDEGSRILITGDPKQHDRGYEKNGLADFIHRMDGRKSNHIAICKFTAKHVERSPIVAEMMDIYGEE